MTVDKETYDQLHIDFVARGVKIKELEEEIGKYNDICVRERRKAKQLQRALDAAQKGKLPKFKDIIGLYAD